MTVAVAATTGAASPAQASCAAPANAIEAENCRPGTPQAEWDVSGAGDPNLQGFATDISVDQGQAVSFKVSAASAYRIDIYRLGWYAGNGARLVGTIGQLGANSQPNCLRDADTGLVDCANWAVSASWTVPADAVSGVYLARLVRSGGASHVPFIVRDDDGRSDVLFQTADTTWQAYNNFGGNSLYTGTSRAAPGRAVKVSYNRPFSTRSVDRGQDWLFNSEYPMIRWLERNGYDVSYFTGVDSDRLGAEIQEHRTFLSVGHDEYWSGGQRANLEAARDAGVNLAFFSGNEVFWKTRWEGGHRTLVSYKETRANAKIDPTSVWTGTWRDPRFSPPSDGGRPENALTGTSFLVNSGTAAITVPAADGLLRFWRNTGVAGLAPGQAATLAAGTLGYEWDTDPDNGARPPGLVRLSSTTVNGVETLQDFGSTYRSGNTATHHLTLYRAPSAALVFGAGTIQWPWGLDATHDRSGPAPDPSMQQATVNLLADMGAQPATLATGVPATASTDTIPPTTAITSVSGGPRVTVTGTATDTGGGRVGAVEVSTDGGATWHPAEGRENWTYTYTQDAANSAAPRSRASDDSANLFPRRPGAGGATAGAGAAPAPTARARTRRVRMSRRGAVRLRVACRSRDRRCRVFLRLRIARRTVAARRLTIRGGSTRFVKVVLDRKARRLVLRRRSVRARVVLVRRNAAGARRVTRKPIRVLAPRRR